MESETRVAINSAAHPSSGQAPLAVQFTGQSTGPVTAWNWSFGDGATSAVQNPTHTYYSVGSPSSATVTIVASLQL